MNSQQSDLVRKLIEEGLANLRAPRQITAFGTGIPQAEALLNDIDTHPHFFVLACVMDRQIPAERAWAIPYKVSIELGGFGFETFYSVEANRIDAIFRQGNLHRFNATMSDCFHSAIQDIHTKYNDDASCIWKGRPRSAAVIRRFLEFSGVGPKIATMATNILVRDFKVPMDDYSSIDISADVQVRKFLTHHGLLREGASNDELIYLARELYPDFPGIFDYVAWKEGRKL
jgi:endonuclease-3